MEYAALYLESIDMVKTSQHRDYAGIFFRNLSPAFLGQQQHLDKFRQIHSEVLVSRPEDSHFLNLLSNEIEKMELIMKIKGNQ